MNSIHMYLNTNRVKIAKNSWCEFVNNSSLDGIQIGSGKNSPNKLFNRLRLTKKSYLTEKVFIGSSTTTFTPFWSSQL